MSIIKQVHTLCLEHNISISVAESCTSGIVASTISSFSGSSKYFKGGVVAYNNDIKVNVLDVSAELILKTTAVSPEVVKQMAKNIRLKFNSDLSLATTGYAGPTGGTSKNPVGTIYIALADSFKTSVDRFMFQGNRKEIINQAAFQALLLLHKYIKNIKKR